MKSNKGFTLIELLVVVAIIGVLASVVLASLSNARDKAKLAKFSGELRQVQTGLFMYLEDNGNYNFFGDRFAYFYANGNTSPTWSTAVTNLEPYFDLNSFVDNQSNQFSDFWLRDFDQAHPFIRVRFRINDGDDHVEIDPYFTGTSCYTGYCYYIHDIPVI